MSFVTVTGMAQNVTLNFTLGVAGVPADDPTAFCAPCVVGRGSGRPGYETSFSDTAILTVEATAGGNPPLTTVTLVHLARMDFWGNNTGTQILLTPQAYRGDNLDFEDGTATWGNTGRTGTAKLAFGVGAFASVKMGSLAYTYNCSKLTNNPCYKGSGDPGFYTYKFDLEGTGYFQMPINEAQTAFPTLYPTLLQQLQNGVVAVNNSAKTATSTGTQPASHSLPSYSVQGMAVPDQDGTPAAGVSGTYTIIPPLQVSAATYAASATCLNAGPGCWLTIPNPTGAVAAFAAAPISVNFNQGDYGPGVYPANVSVTVTPSGNIGPPINQVLPFSLVVTDGAPLLQLSETGVQFQVLAGAKTPSVHAISVGTSGTTFSYQASASTLSGGNWLTVSPGVGTASAGAPGTLNINANPAGLAAGSYFGRVDVAVPGAVGSPQSVEVELTVASNGTAPILSTTALLFTTPQKSNPAPQTVVVSTFSTAPLSILSGISPDTEQSWLTVTASSSTLASAAPVTLNASVDASGLTPGAYTATFFVQNLTTQATYPISVILIVKPATGACTPTQLLPAFTNLTSSFEVPTATPVSLQAQIVDDCGALLTSGIVEAAPSADAVVEMMPVGNGQWAGTWMPHATAGGGASVVLSAQSAAGLQGSITAIGTLDANPTAALVNPGGIVSAANPVLGAPIAPGEFISIYGSNLAPTNASSPSLPYLTTLAGTQVLLGGQPLPLQFVSAGLINAVVPFETPVNGFQELLISQNGTYSLPESVVVASVSPAIFTQSETGQGAGVIVVYKSNGTVYETSSTQPASAGDLLLIYAAGLGPVDPAVADGMAAPLSAPFPATVNPVTATVGGQPAQVQFAGLAPGYAGVYQVNVIVPPGVAAGATVPVILTVGGFSSAPVTVAIQ